MIVTICYFPKSIRSVFILVQCNISLRKNYVAHLITVVCVTGWIWAKNKPICTFWLSMQKKSVVEQGFFYEFAFDNKALKTFAEFQICWKHWKFGSSNVVKFEFELFTSLTSDTCLHLRDNRCGANLSVYHPAFTGTRCTYPERDS